MWSLSNVKGRMLYRIMSMSCATAFLLYGYDAGVLGGIQHHPPFLDALGNPTGTYVIPLVASSYTLAAAFCCVFVAIWGKGIGRRNCILIGDVFVIVGGSLQASSWSVAQIIVARVLCGVGIGFISSTVPTYMAEMSIEVKERGPEVAIQCSFIICGIALAYWIDFGFTQLTSQISWRFPIAFQLFFAILSAIGMFLLPDTPRWYYAKGRTEEGDSVLCRLHDLPLNDIRVQETKQEILSAIEMESSETSKFKVLELVWDDSDLQVGRRIRIAFLLLFIQTLMGINLLVYYSTLIFANMGYSPFLSGLLAAIMNTLFAIGTLFLPSTVERFGRRPILLWTAVGCTVCMLIFVTMICLPNQTTATGWTAVAAVILYNFFFGYGYAGVPWLYGVEISPLTYRHIGGAAVAFGQWFGGFITVFAGGIAIEEVGPKIWIWQLLACALQVIFVYFMCPETTNMTLENIDYLFAKPDVRAAMETRGSALVPLGEKSHVEEIEISSGSA